MINGSLSMLCAVLAVLLIFALQLSPQWRRIPAAKPAILTMAFVFLVLISESIAFFLQETNAAVFNIFAVVNGVASFAVEWTFGLMVVARVKVSAKMKRGMLTALGVFCVVGTVLYIVNGIHPVFFDYYNMQYLSFGGYLILTILNYGFFIGSTILLLIKGNNIPLRDRIFLVITQLIPIFSVVLDAAFPGLYSWDVLVFIAVAANYIHLMFVSAETAQKKIDRMELDRIRATQERMKPHYIYNVLSSIYYLCEEDPKTAQKAISIFSDYLRGVLKMMDTESLILFSEELKTVYNYVDLEKMRFGDQFEIRYNIEAKDFRIPPFTVQPLVENAVKHGLEKGDGKGEILVESYEDPNGYYINVYDNYGGFDPETEKTGTGFGTRYIRNMLALTGCGEMTLQSDVDGWTVATVYINKKASPPKPDRRPDRHWLRQILGD